MNSLIAEVITLLKHNLPLGGISPVPVPPDAVFPYITVADIGTQEVESLQGVSGLFKSIVQVDCWDKSHETAFQTRTAARDFLLDFRGVAGTVTVSWVHPVVDTAFYDGNRSLHQCIARVCMWWAR